MPFAQPSLRRRQCKVTWSNAGGAIGSCPEHPQLFYKTLVFPRKWPFIRHVRFSSSFVFLEAAIAPVLGQTKTNQLPIMKRILTVLLLVVLTAGASIAQEYKPF